MDLREDAHGLCILMEYITGYTLNEKVTMEPNCFSKQENLRKFLLQLCEALKALHRENVVHMDITPSNIIITINIMYFSRAMRVRRVGFSRFCI